MNAIVSLALCLSLSLPCSLSAQFAMLESASQARQLETTSPMPRPASTGPLTQSLLSHMHQHVAGLAAHRYRLWLAERTQADRYESELLMQVQPAPLHIRAEWLAPQAGQVLEYRAAEHPAQAVYQPQKWLPRIRIVRSLHDPLLRPGHHAIPELTPTYFSHIIARMEQHFLQQGEYASSVQYLGSVALDGQPFHRIDLLDADYHLQEYQLLEGETLISLAQKRALPPYKLLDLNPRFASYADAGPGEVILVPSSYAPKIKLWLDAGQSAIRRIEIYDEIGWLARYDFLELMPLSLQD